MRKTTQENKLNALLGLTEKAVEVKAKSTGKITGVSEEEIQNFREAQGLIYFLQAPALFTPRTCNYCGEPFLVSRRNVAYCSYQCIKNSLAAVGIKWSKDGDLEALAMDPQVYNGNEPLWVRHSMLEKLRAMASSTQQNSNETLPAEEVPTLTELMSPYLGHQELSPATTFSSEMQQTQITQPLSSPAGTTSSQKPIGKRSSRKRGVKRVITSLD